MAVSITGPAGSLELGGSAALGTEIASAELEVWITESGSGARVAQIPDEHIVSCPWSETMDAIGSSTATLTVDHYGKFPDDSWIADELIRVEREVQISWAGRVMHWGPVVSVKREPGEATIEATVAGPEYWLGLRLVEGDESTWGREQIRGIRTWSPALDVSSTELVARGSFSYRTSEWRFTAEVWVGGSVPDDTVVLRAFANPGGMDPQQGDMVFARDLTRDTWTTAVIHTTFTSTSGAGGAPRTWYMGVGGGLAGPDDVVVREVSAQVSPTSVGFDETETEVELVPVWDTWMEAVGRISDLGISAWIDGSIAGVMEASWRRPDVSAAEAARQVVDTGYGECDFGLTPATRVCRCWVLRGVEHDPEDLTLTAADGGPVTAWGTLTSGLDTPITEWVVANDEGFTGSYHDTTRFGGLKLQAYSAAPTGTAASALKARAERLGYTAVSALSEELTAEVEMSLVASLWVGDRVQVVIDDGPTQIDGLWRVRSKSVDPAKATFTVGLAPWVEP
jgi:hypothetical protein